MHDKIAFIICADAIAKLGRGRVAGETADDYAMACAKATERLAAANGKTIARAIELLSANGQGEYAADALKVLAMTVISMKMASDSSLH